MEERTTQPDLALALARCGAGDAAAFATVDRWVRPVALRRARRVLQDAALAEEVAQEVLLEVWLKAATFDPERGDALAWASTIAHRRAVDVVRAVTAARRRDALDHRERSALEVGEDVDTGLLASADAERVHELLARLSPLQRHAVTAAHLHGRALGEVAASLGVPVSTLKARIRGGLARMAREAREAQCPPPDAGA